MSRFLASPETFVVEEIAAYEPRGEGSHTFLWIEKRDLTTPEAARRLARTFGLEARDVGWAGMKDRHATTRQWLSLPDVAPEVALTSTTDGLRVLEARRHGNKLRVGHLRGNRFEVVLTAVDDAEAAALAQELVTIARQGLPNAFGRQRFGAAGDNVARGLGILRGERRERDHKKRQLMLSALQAEVFNRALALRAAEGGLRRVRAGDVLQKTASGGVFISEDRERDQARVESGEVVPTGPLPGTREIEPPEGSEARGLEDRALAAVGVSRADLAAAGRNLPGARRAVLIPVTLADPPTERGGDALRLRFSLPAGGYATVLLEALAAACLASGKAVLTFDAFAASTPPRL